MCEDAAIAIKARLRVDLSSAMKGRRNLEAKAIREIIAAIDNAEAPPISVGQATGNHHHFLDGSAEVERLLLSRSDVRRILLAEIPERECAAAELERLGVMERAEVLRAEVLHINRYAQNIDEL